MAADPQPSAFVSAGAGGAGREIALTLARAGFQVLAVDADAAAVASLRGLHPLLRVERADMAEEADVERAVDGLLAWTGRVDAMVNNVGIAGPTAAVEDVTLEEWEATMRVNLTSHFLCVRRAVPAMKAQGGGCIIGISSSSAMTGLPLRLPYVVSKAGVLSMTRNLARELGPYGIRVNAILPGPIEGERLQRIVAAKAAALGTTPDAYRADMLRYVSLRTAIPAGDIAGMAAFLAGPGGARISGQCISVDGNMEYEE